MAAPVIARAVADRDKAGGGVEPTRCRIVGCDFQHDRGDRLAPRLVEDSAQQFPADTAAAASRKDAERQDLAFAAEIAGEREADRHILLPGEKAELAVQRQDVAQRVGIPRIFRKTHAMQMRQRLGCASRQRRDMAAHGAAAGSGTPRLGKLTSGGRK